MKITCTGDIGDFTQGQVLKRDNQIALYHRLMLDEGAETPSKLTDSEIMAVVEEIDGDSEDAEFARIEALEKGSDLTAKGTVEIAAVSATGNRIALAAVNMAHKLGALFKSDVEKVIDADETKKRGPVIIAQDIEHDLTAEEISSLPEPGSKVETVGANGNYDRYTETVIVDGSARKKPASFYRKMWDSSVAGAPILATLANIDAAIADKADAPAEFKRMPKADRTATRARWARRRNTGSSNLTQAVRLLQQKARIVTMDKVGFRYLLDRDEKGNVKTDEHGREMIKNTPTPIVLYDKAEPTTAHVCSVGTFLTYKVDDAKAKGGTLADLLETASRGTPTPKGTETPRYDLDVFSANVNLMVDYKETVEADDALIGNLYARLNAQAGEALLVNIFRLEEFLEKIVSKKDLAKRYAAIEAELADTSDATPEKKARREALKAQFTKGTAKAA